MMKIRRNVLPSTVVDTLCFFVVFIFVPITYIFEITVVLPACHSFGSFWYVLIFATAAFFLFQIVGNMIACLVVDTTVDFASLEPPTEEDIRKLWHRCDACSSLAPPRSWHCKVCRACILKRDHHCFFFGCCIGHLNQRFFVMFLFHMLLGSGLALIYNSIYFWHINGAVYANWDTALKFVCPLMMLVTGASWNDFLLLLYGMNAFAVVISSILFLYHGSCIWFGGVCYERGNYNYDLGWQNNMQMVFGDKMYWVCVSPLMKSVLPHDGVHWKPVQYQKQD